MHMSDSIAVMNQGRIEQYGSAFALYRQPHSRFVAGFIGKSNLLEGTVSAGVFRAEGVAVALPEAGPDGAAALMLRPEDAALSLTPGEDGRAALPAEVVSSTYSGDRALYTLALGPRARFLIYGPARAGLIADGARVFVTFDPQDCLLLR